MGCNYSSKKNEVIEENEVVEEKYKFVKYYGISFDNIDDDIRLMHIIYDDILYIFLKFGDISVVRINEYDLPKLNLNCNVLIICDCDNLTSVSNIQSLELLVIYNCPKLREISNLCYLKYLKIIECPSLIHESYNTDNLVYLSSPNYSCVEDYKKHQNKVKAKILLMEKLPIDMIRLLHEF